MRSGTVESEMNGMTNRIGGMVLAASLLLVAGCDNDNNAAIPAAAESATPTSSAAATESAEPTGIAETSMTELEALVEKYGDLGLTDVHNHDASGFQWNRTAKWERNRVARVVLFGDVSEPSAVRTDKAAWSAYRKDPERIVPYFSGFDLHDESSLDVVRDNLEKGYFGLGEIVAASTNSPVASKVAWKGFDPMDGYLPRIYELCAEYKAPILLHIDPLAGTPLIKLEEALDAYPDTIIIVGHINAYNSPDLVEALMKKHPNLYGDFFAGFTDLNPASEYALSDYVPVIKKFSDRFLLSTDSGYGLPSEEAAIESMYRMLDLLSDDPSVMKRVARDNYDAILRAQPATKTQLEAIKKLTFPEGGQPDLTHMSKLDAGTILIDAKVDLSESAEG